MTKIKIKADYDSRTIEKLWRLCDEYGTLRWIQKIADQRIAQVKSDMHDLLGVSKVYNLNEQQVSDFVKCEIDLPSGKINYYLKESVSVDWEELKKLLTEDQMAVVRITNPHSELKITPKEPE